MFDPDLLKNKTVIITGGGTGLGKSMAQRFGELGANLVITSRKLEVLEETAEEIRTSGASVLPVQCDVRKPAEVEKMVSQTVEEFGSVNVLVNNAAGNFISPTEKLSPGGFQVIVDIVLNGTFNCTLSVGQEMIKSGGGVILNIITTYAWTGSGYVVPSACRRHRLRLGGCLR